MTKHTEPRRGWDEGHSSSVCHFFVGDPENKGRPESSLCGWFSFRKWSKHSDMYAPGRCKVCQTKLKEEQA